MNGFWALVKKEALEQRRTWKLAGMIGVYTLLGLAIVIVAFIVAEIQDEPRTSNLAEGLLYAFGLTLTGVGTFIAIIIAMGAIAGERASGTAAMTLSKPVTRLAFVAVKFIGLVLSIYIAIAVASGIMFLATVILIDTWSAWRFFVFMAIVGVYLVFNASVAFFWSGMFSRQLLAGGLAVLIFFILTPLAGIPKTEGYWPIDLIEFAGNVADEESVVGDTWKSLAVSLGAIAVLASGSWLVFRRKEL